MRIHLGAAFVVGYTFLTLTAYAKSGHPIAVRWWGEGMVSVETYWDLTVVIDPHAEKAGRENLSIAGDLVLTTNEHVDQRSDVLGEGMPVVESGLSEDKQARVFRKVLDRLPGNKKPRWSNARLKLARSEHAIRVTSIPAWRDSVSGAQRGATAMFLIEVDGVRIVHCGNLGQTKLSAEQLQDLGKVDVLLIPVGGAHTVDGSQAAEIVREVDPQIAVPIHYNTASTTSDLDGLERFLTATENNREVARVNGNTLAVSVAERLELQEDESKKVVVLHSTPWAMSRELSELFAAKERACHASQAVFAKLSAGQMNFQPANGTHTPRWNSEHMMGRELLFFSQIYAQADPSIKILDLNPAQMPPDYLAAHPEWDGAEEARQMERVTAFTRRFAYLLKGLPLDEKAPGSFWTPRKLLKQMERHYNEHTANVKKKFDLPDWPAE